MHMTAEVTFVTALGGDMYRVHASTPDLKLAVDLHAPTYAPVVGDTVELKIIPQYIATPRMVVVKDEPEPEPETPKPVKKAAKKKAK